VTPEPAAVATGDGARSGRLFGLSEREREVLALLAEGLSDREIGESLSISPRTVSKHVAAILGKLGVSTRTAAAMSAQRAGLL
jgi:DNA-binding NarL/FixJ family response regulator